MAESDILVLRPKKRSAIGLLIGFTLFVAGGVWLAMEGEWIGYFCVVFFGLGIPVAIVQLLPGSTFLEISPSGLRFANLFHVTTIPWSMLDEFVVMKIKTNGITAHKMVGFNYSSSVNKSRLALRLSSALASCEGALPNTYGKSAEELVDILNSCLAQFRTETEQAEQLDQADQMDA